MMVNILSVSVEQLELNDSTVDIGAVNISQEHWDGHYLESNGTLFSRPLWRKDAAEDPAGAANRLSWRPHSWVLYSALTGHELLLLDDMGLHPPTGAVSTWSFYTDANVTAQIELECSETVAPTSAPSASPSASPSQPPSSSPSASPSLEPTPSPTANPSSSPSQPPSASPSTAPSPAPSTAPSQPPTASPSTAPSLAPSMAPTQPPSRSPTTSCELLRVRVTSTVPADEARAAQYAAEFSGSFEQQTSASIDFRTTWIRWSDGARVEYSAQLGSWLITASSSRLTVESAGEMPPLDAMWRPSDDDSLQVGVETECAVYTDAPTGEPTAEPTLEPTVEPTQQTATPTRAPTGMPTTSWPTTIAPTLPPVDECSRWGVRYSVAITLRLLGWTQNLETEGALRELLQTAFVSGILQRWAPWAWRAEWCSKLESMAYVVVALRRRRALLQEPQDVEVEAVFLVNADLFADVFNASEYNATAFAADMASVVAQGLEQEGEAGGGGGGELGALDVSEEFTQSMQTTMATTQVSKDDTGDALDDDCDAIWLKCWMLYASLLAVALVLLLGAAWFCRKTRADVASGKFTSVETTAPGLEMTSPTSPAQGLNRDVAAGAGAQNLDL